MGFRNLPGGGARQGILRIVFSTASMSGGAGVGQLMMLSWPHHRTRLLSPALPGGTPVVVPDLRGQLRHVLGSDWILGWVGGLDTGVYVCVCVTCVCV